MFRLPKSESVESAAVMVAVETGVVAAVVVEEADILFASDVKLKLDERVCKTMCLITGCQY